MFGNFERWQRICALSQIGIAKITIMSWPMLLYGRALTVAQEIHTPENDEDAFVTRIRKDQQAVFEMLRSGESNQETPPLEKAKGVGR